MRLRVATLNVWALPEPFSRDLGGRMSAIARSLPAQGLDVVGFQEVWGGVARDKLIEAGRRAGLAHAWSGRGALDSGGLLLLSRFPIRAARFERFLVRGNVERISQGEYLAGKGYLSALLDTPAGAVRLLDTHLHARYGAQAPHAYQPHRTAQIVQLAAGERDADSPLVVLGDFNFGEEDPEYRILTGLMGLRDAVAELDRREPTVFGANAYRAGPFEQRKDLVFGRNGIDHSIRPLHAERVFDEDLLFDGRPGAYSNHAGVRVDFDLEPCAGSAPARPDRSVLELATDLLVQGRAAAQQCEQSQRAWALQSAGVGAAAIVAARCRPVSRRSILRLALQALGLTVVVPGLGLSVLSSWLTPDEARAFAHALRTIRRLADS